MRLCVRTRERGHKFITSSSLKCRERLSLVRRFLGLAFYYRRFIPNFAELTSPLTDLTRNGASDPVQWTEQCQGSLERVKQALCGEPLLHTPKSRSLLSCRLMRRAGGRPVPAGTGRRPPGVIHQPKAVRKGGQVQHSGEGVPGHPLCSRCSAVLPAGAPIHPHAPLQWLHRMKDVNTRITRWYLALQPFNFRVIHRPGAQGRGG